MSQKTTKPRIEDLTPEQEALLDVYTWDWTRIGLCTLPADRERAEEAIRRMYAAAEPPLEAPAEIVWADSPLLMLRQAETAEATKFTPASCVYGQFDAGWLSRYAYYREVLGLTEETELLVGLMELAKSAGWALPLAGRCYVSERPMMISTDDTGALHSEVGPALAYRNDPESTIYAWHGMEVEAWIIMEPGRITAAMALAESNEERRRVLIERVGWEKFLVGCGAELVHEDSYGQLYRVRATGADRATRADRATGADRATRADRATAGREEILMVRVKNGTPEPDGTRREYVLPVHPELRPLLAAGGLGNPQELTARNAVASTYGRRGEEYKPRVRT